MSQCSKCGIELVPGQNWSDGMVKARSKLCRACNSAKGKAWSKTNRARSRSVAMDRRHSDPQKTRDAKNSYYARNKEKWRGYAENFRNKMLTDPIRRAQLMLTFTRTRAAKRGIEFDLDLEFVQARLLKGVCEATDMPLVFEKFDKCKTNKHPRSPSLDRIDPRCGYTKENTRVVAYIYNVAKSDYSDNDVAELAKAIVAKLSR